MAKKDDQEKELNLLMGVLHKDFGDESIIEGIETSKIKSCNIISTRCLALDYALKYTNVKCLIIMQSKNVESYMFHTPNIEWAKTQAECTRIPYIVQLTAGEKERELKDLEAAIKKAKVKYKVQAIVTGAIESVYQASRVQTITNSLGMECFNPLWQKDQIELLEELIEKKYEIIISSIAADGFSEKWLRDP